MLSEKSIHPSSDHRPPCLGFKSMRAQVAIATPTSSVQSSVIVQSFYSPEKAFACRRKASDLPRAGEGGRVSVRIQNNGKNLIIQSGIGEIINHDSNDYLEEREEQEATFRSQSPHTWSFLMMPFLQSIESGREYTYHVLCNDSSRSAEYHKFLNNEQKLQEEVIKRTASAKLKQIRQHSSPFGDCNVKDWHIISLMASRNDSPALGKCYSPGPLHEIRQQLLTSLMLIRLYVTIGPFKEDDKICCANRTIARVTVKATSVHIIDFGIRYGIFNGLALSTVNH
ncbi:hypothetical protein NC653_022630 [Populus alba x Populus x berolinensis]|uniref:Uncharacterized protein n=1 Tax=Populus alba x Populus x berolinensis TaxID=444605 RepID=A0AAD6MGM9_9ROSI|nr:hypothetical protein NC653_022630 [Populus alba x Populus x berolinensis]